MDRHQHQQKELQQKTLIFLFPGQRKRVILDPYNITATNLLLSMQGSPTLFHPSPSAAAHTGREPVLEDPSESNASLIRKMRELLGQLELNICQSQTSCREAVYPSITLNSPMSTSVEFASYVTNVKTYWTKNFIWRWK